MNDPDWLLDIRANPEADEPRLRYADHLTTRGDPRGEFIRVQCALARLPAYEDAAVPLRLREAELLAEHGGTWIQALPPGVTRFAFRRGLLEEVDIRAEGYLKHTAQLFQSPILGLRVIDGSNDRWEELIVQMAASPDLERLRSLEIGSNCMSSRGARALARSAHTGNLLALTVGPQNVEEWYGAEIFRGWTEGLRLPKLTTLSVSERGNIRPKYLARLLASPALARLQSLRLDIPSAIDDESLFALADSPHLTRLKSLALMSGNLSVAAARRLRDAAFLNNLSSLELKLKAKPTAMTRLLEAPRLTAVERLLLSGMPVDENGFRALGNTTQFSRLRELSCSFTTVRQLRALTEAKLPRLTRLNLGGNRIQGAESVATLLKAVWLPQLESLRLDTCSFGDDGVCALAAVPAVANLRHLDLTNNNLSSAAVRALATSPYLGRLRALDLSHNPLGPEGMAELAATTTLALLTDLHLLHCNLGNAGVAALARAPFLSRLLQLDLSRNEIGPEGARALVAATMSNLLSLSLRGAAYQVGSGGVTHDVKRLGNEGVAILAGAATLPRLAELDLYWNEIGDAGAAALAGGTGLPGLTTLDLGWNLISDVGVQAFADAPRLARLLSINFDSNRINSDGIRALRHSPHLAARAVVHGVYDHVISVWRAWHQ